MNCGELLSKWVGESTKNIDAIFQEARSSDAILVFDEAEGLFGQRTNMRWDTIYMYLKAKPIAVNCHLFIISVFLYIVLPLIAMLMSMLECCSITLRGSQEL